MEPELFQLKIGLDHFNTFAKKEAKKGANEYVKIFNSHIGNRC